MWLPGDLLTEHDTKTCIDSGKEKRKKKKKKGQQSLLSEDTGGVTEKTSTLAVTRTNCNEFWTSASARYCCGFSECWELVNRILSPRWVWLTSWKYCKAHSSAQNHQAIEMKRRGRGGRGGTGGWWAQEGGGERGEEGKRCPKACVGVFVWRLELSCVTGTCFISHRATHRAALRRRWKR